MTVESPRVAGVGLEGLPRNQTHLIDLIAVIVWLQLFTTKHTRFTFRLGWRIA